jgi:hypothetical protein
MAQQPRVDQIIGDFFRGHQWPDLAHGRLDRLNQGAIMDRGSLLPLDEAPK